MTGWGVEIFEGGRPRTARSPVFLRPQNEKPKVRTP